MSDNSQVGRIGWIDMTVDDADGLRDFYKNVVGWGVEDVSMGDYSDYSMTQPESGEAVSGICHARGGNADLPGGWLIYITVADVDASEAACTANGGEVLVAPKGLAGGRFCVIRDPSGATAALYQP
ncbi:MAG: VOC family protein [Gammaproteobacteria bacterium]|nr:VOC family protein [Gammaproteobacteria bacterium]